MAKLGTYSYPDIRFGDAVEIAGRILSKFKGTVSVKGLAWELGMAEGSGTLFAKVAALRDFGLVEGRGELRISALAQRILHATTPEDGRQARAEAFSQVELLRQLYNRFEGEVPDDLGLLVGLEEITRSSRDEIVRRSSLIQKHLADGVRVLGRVQKKDETPEYSGQPQNIPLGSSTAPLAPPYQTVEGASTAGEGGLLLSAGHLRLAVPLTAEYVDIAIKVLVTLRAELQAEEASEAHVAPTTVSTLSTLSNGDLSGTETQDDESPGPQGNVLTFEVTDDSGTLADSRGGGS
jgi:hypothetical protein